MTDNEKLIEEARAFVASWDMKGSWSSDSPVGMVARLADALAVFEKAHTPNVRDPEKTHIPTEAVSLSVHTPRDDEREAQGWREAALYDGDAQTQDDFMTGWRTADRTRSVVPEPSGGLCLECGTQCAVPEHDAPEPQGEPSDAQVQAAFDIIRTHRGGTGLMAVVRDALRAASAIAEQGENR